MSLSSSGNLVSGYAPFAVLQQGELTKVANTALVIPCPQILATDNVLIVPVSKSAGAGTSTPVEYITIQEGVSFTSTSYFADFAGVYKYVVVRSVAKVIPPP
jgi:hypothetical protein